MSVFSVNAESVALGINNRIKLMETEMPEYKDIIAKPREAFRSMIEAMIGKKL